LSSAKLSVQKLQKLGLILLQINRPEYIKFLWVCMPGKYSLNLMDMATKEMKFA
jgi:hypothetical protein